MSSRTIDIHALNELPEAELSHELFHCCGSVRWVKQMIARKPYETMNGVIESSREIWVQLEKDDWLEALHHHPRIGSFEESMDNRADWEETRESAEEEHKGIEQAGLDVLRELSRLNREYEQRFGYIYLVSASGKSADELLAILQARLKNNPDDEILNVRDEQEKITETRLRKLLCGPG